MTITDHVRNDIKSTVYAWVKSFYNDFTPQEKAEYDEIENN